MVRATNSLPVPVSPVTSTVSVCPATRSTMPMNLCMIGLAIRNCVPSISRRASGTTAAAARSGGGTLPGSFFAVDGLDGKSKNARGSRVRVAQQRQT